MSGAVTDRPALHDALEFARGGDTVIVWKLDRLARSMKQLIETVETLRARGIGFRSLTEALDTTTAQGRLVFHMFGALAEFERSLIRERTQAGLAAARRAGRTGGRRRNSPTTTLRPPRRCSPTPISASPKSRTASASLRRRSIGTSLPREPRIRRAFDNGRSTPKTGRSRRVSAWRRAAAVRRFRTLAKAGIAIECAAPLAGKPVSCDTLFNKNGNSTTSLPLYNGGRKWADHHERYTADSSQWSYSAWLPYSSYLRRQRRDPRGRRGLRFPVLQRVFRALRRLNMQADRGADHGQNRKRRDCDVPGGGLHVSGHSRSVDCQPGRRQHARFLRAAGGPTRHNLVDFSAQTEHSAGAHQLGPDTARGRGTTALLPEEPPSRKSVGELLQLPLQFADIYPWHRCAGSDVPLSDWRVAGGHSRATAHRVFDAGWSRRPGVLRHEPRLRAAFDTLVAFGAASAGLGQHLASKLVSVQIIKQRRTQPRRIPPHAKDKSSLRFTRQGRGLAGVRRVCGAHLPGFGSSGIGSRDPGNTDPTATLRTACTALHRAAGNSEADYRAACAGRPLYGPQRPQQYSRGRLSERHLRHGRSAGPYADGKIGDVARHRRHRHFRQRRAHSRIGPRERAEAAVSA